jgi:hypothetical protein
MIAMIHSARWLETGSRFVEGPIDYIRAPQAYAYPRQGF